MYWLDVQERSSVRFNWKLEGTSIPWEVFYGVARSIGSMRRSEEHCALMDESGEGEYEWVCSGMAGLVSRTMVLSNNSI